MGCDRCSYGEDCIRDIVAKIVAAQREATEEEECVTSCDQSIDDLLNPKKDRKPTRYTTIPIMLYCKDSCKPFVGSGFISRNRGGKRSHFECLESPIFKVNGFVKGSDSCVRLELLLPVGGRRGSGDQAEDRGLEPYARGSFCDTFGQRRIENFKETGLCITIDLDCFCGITCLDPITPER